MPGPQELIVIAIVALLVFGPDRLPEVMRNAAKLLARFREQSQRSIEELKRAADVDELGREVRGISRELNEAASSVKRDLSGLDPLRDPGAPKREARSAPSADDPPPVDSEAT